MNSVSVTVEGVVKPDGTLEVPGKLDLPAGRVQVTVQPASEPVQPERFWTMMESLWTDLRAAAEPPARARKSMRRSTPCATKRKRRCRLWNASRKTVAGPGSKPRGQRSSLTDGLSGRNPVIYPIEQPAQLGPKAKVRVSQLLVNGERPAVSDLVRMKCQVGPLNSNDAVLPAKYATFYASPDLDVLPDVAGCMRPSGTDSGTIWVQTSGLPAPGCRRRAWVYALSTKDAQLKSFPDILVEILS